MTRNITKTVQKELRGAVELRKQLEEWDVVDPEALALSIQSETNLEEAIDAVFSEIAERESAIAGLKEREQTIAERRCRHEKTVDTLRAVILQAMDLSGVEKVSLPEATISVKKVAPSAEIAEEADIPAEFWEPQPPKLNKKALTEALKEGRAVEGARLGNGGISLAIRTK